MYRVCFFLWHLSVLINQSIKLSQSISYLSYQVILCIAFLHLSVVSLCQLVKSPGRSVFQVYLIPLLLIVTEISISKHNFVPFLKLSEFISFLGGSFALVAKVAHTFLVNGATVQTQRSTADHWLQLVDHSSSTVELGCLCLTETPCCLRL